MSLYGRVNTQNQSFECFNIIGRVNEFCLINYHTFSLSKTYFFGKVFSEAKKVEGVHLLRA